MEGGKPAGRHQEKRLTATKVRALDKPGLHGDGNGLYLKVDASGAKRWIQRLVIQGKRRDLGLGSVSVVSLAEAREQAFQNRKLARMGEDPLAARKQLEAIPSFEDAAREVYSISHPNWRDGEQGKHGKQWLSTLEKHVFPAFGSKPSDKVTGADVLGALLPIWNRRPETARRAKQRISTVLKWVMAQGWRHDNPAEIIAIGLPRHDRSMRRHQPALPYGDVADAISKVQASEAGVVTKLAFEFLVLTASRSGEVRGALWQEIDLPNAIWTIPAGRMKAKRIHRVPLSPRAVAILQEAERFRSGEAGDQLVFPGLKPHRPLSDMTLSKLVKQLGIAAVPHGFRSSFRDWAGETTAHPREVIEFALAHVIPNKVEAAYARSDLFQKRRDLMDDWENYLKA